MWGKYVQHEVVNMLCAVGGVLHNTLNLCANVEIDAALVSLLVGLSIPEPLDRALATNVASGGKGVGDGDVPISCMVVSRKHTHVG